MLAFFNLKVLALLIFSLCFFSSLQSQTHTIKSTNGSLNVPYWEYLPPAYTANSSNQYPVIIFLHGRGERGDGSSSAMNNVLKLGPPKHIQNGHDMCFTVDGKEECFIVISPQLNTSYSGWNPNVFYELIDHVLNGSENYNIDASRVYLTGLSLGGIGTYYNLVNSQNSSNIFAAAVPVAARGPEAAACDISELGISVWAHHGDLDGVVNYQSGYNMFNAIVDCTTPVPTGEMKFTTYENIGHNSWTKAYMTDNSIHQQNIYQWLLTKSRDIGEPLPVEFLSFSAIKVEDGVELKWSTATESNNAFFTVERSSNLDNFTPIYSIDGAENSNSIREYSIVDTEPLENNFYRIRQTDFDGQFEFSNTVSNHFEYQSELKLYPNPTTERVVHLIGRINPKSEIVYITLIDSFGTSVFEKTEYPKEIKEGAELNLPTFIKSGIYQVLIEDGFDVTRLRLLVND